MQTVRIADHGSARRRIRELADRIAGGVQRRSSRLREAARYAMNQNVSVAYWWRGRRNFGDEFTSLLVEHIVGARPVHVDDMPQGYSGPVLLGVGSILQHREGRGLIVWGSGLIGADRFVKSPPTEIRAVRGPLTRQLLLEQGLTCPEVFGDPALLYPRFYRPTELVRGAALGLVPHLVDKTDPQLLRLSALEGTSVIDVQQHPHTVIQQICACQAVASSSLHGLIIAQAYGIPAVWVDFSADVLGGGFKFHDFFQSIGAEAGDARQVNSKTTVEQLLDEARCWPIDLDLDALMRAFPVVERRRSFE